MTPRPRPGLHRTARAWWPALLWMALIYAASSVERPPSLPGGLPDVVAHAGIYAVLSMLVLRGVVLARGTGITVAAAAAAVTVAIGYGVTDEWHQSFVAGRTADVRDVVADAVGAIAGAGLAWACAIVLGRRAAAE